MEKDQEASCLICYDEGPDVLHLGCPGSHTFCGPCLTQWLTSGNPGALLDGAVNLPHCPNCKQEKGPPGHIPLEVLPLLVARGHMTPEQEARFHRQYVRLTTSDTIYACINPACDNQFAVEAPDPESTQRVYNDAFKVTCSSCSVMQCAACGVPWAPHAGLTCVKYRAREAPADEASRKLLANSVPCPGKCGQGLQRSSGCNVLLCLACKLYVCYLCGEGLDSSKVDMARRGTHPTANKHYQLPGKPCYKSMFKSKTQWLREQHGQSLAGKAPAAAKPAPAAAAARGAAAGAGGAPVPAAFTAAAAQGPAFQHLFPPRQQQPAQQQLLVAAPAFMQMAPAANQQQLGVPQQQGAAQGGVNHGQPLFDSKQQPGTPVRRDPVPVFGQPQQGLFGSPQPAHRELFGSPQPPQGFFGSPAPQQGLFGSPQPQKGLFGSPAPQQGFLGSPAPQQGLFGSPAPQQGLFGSPAPQQQGLFGSPHPQKRLFEPQQPQPAAAAGAAAAAPAAAGAVELGAAERQLKARWAATKKEQARSHELQLAKLREGFTAKTTALREKARLLEEALGQQYQADKADQLTACLQRQQLVLAEYGGSTTDLEACHARHKKQLAQQYTADLKNLQRQHEQAVAQQQQQQQLVAQQQAAAMLAQQQQQAAAAMAAQQQQQAAAAMAAQQQAAAMAAQQQQQAVAPQQQQQLLLHGMQAPPSCFGAASPQAAPVPGQLIVQQSPQHGFVFPRAAQAPTGMFGQQQPPAQQPQQQHAGFGFQAQQQQVVQQQAVGPAAGFVPNPPQQPLEFLDPVWQSRQQPSHQPPPQQPGFFGQAGNGLAPQVQQMGVQQAAAQQQVEVHEQQQKRRREEEAAAQKRRREEEAAAGGGTPQKSRRREQQQRIKQRQRGHYR